MSISYREEMEQALIQIIREERPTKNNADVKAVYDTASSIMEQVAVPLLDSKKLACRQRDAMLAVLQDIEGFMIPGMNWTDDIGQSLKKRVRNVLHDITGRAL